MKLIHLSDLHLGKRLNEYSLLEDQAFILKKILAVVDAEVPDGVLIAGDVYDKSVPSAEAVQLLLTTSPRLLRQRLLRQRLRRRHSKAAHGIQMYRSQRGSTAQLNRYLTRDS